MIRGRVCCKTPERIFISVGVDAKVEIVYSFDPKISKDIPSIMGNKQDFVNEVSDNELLLHCKVLIWA